MGAGREALATYLRRGARLHLLQAHHAEIGGDRHHRSAEALYDLAQVVDELPFARFGDLDPLLRDPGTSARVLGPQATKMIYDYGFDDAVPLDRTRWLTALAETIASEWAECGEPAG